jgi:D-lactate dehydrogenase
LQQLRPLLDEARREKFDSLKILDSLDYLHDMVLPWVGAVHASKRIVLHPVCSLEKMKTGDKLLAVARHFAREVTIPLQAGCCGMAGDRGFLFPEFTTSATSAEAAEVSAPSYDGYYSTTRTCEMAMSEAVTKNYESILYLVDESI